MGHPCRHAVPLRDFHTIRKLFFRLVRLVELVCRQQSSGGRRIALLPSPLMFPPSCKEVFSITPLFTRQKTRIWVSIQLSCQWVKKECGRGTVEVGLPLNPGRAIQKPPQGGLSVQSSRRYHLGAGSYRTSYKVYYDSNKLVNLP